MELTWKEIILVAVGSGGLIGGIVSAFAFVTARIDKRRERLQVDVSQSADLRRVHLEEERLDEGIWESVAKEKAAQIAELRETIQELKVIIRSAKDTFDELELMFRRLRVAKIPDEVVDILSEKIERAVHAIKKGRDALG
jgi:hypothetical protein